MFCDVNYPAHLSPHSLDKYLDKGWFRMGQSMFTTSFLYFNDISYNAIWLRYDLEDYTFRKSSEQILKINSNFKVKIGPLTYSSIKEKLYSKYRSKLPFSIAPTLGALLLEDGQFNVFNSQEVCVYDGKKLIAMGIFDLGETTAQGIVNFYDPEYKKYSLGKFVILQKVLYTQQIGLKYFYPGYFAPGYSLFDYKTELLKSGTSYYDVADTSWKNLSEFSLAEAPLDKIHRKLKELELGLQTIDVKLFTNFYKFYDVKLFREYSGYDLITFPYFIPIVSFERHKEIILTYNIRTEKYQVMICCHVFTISMPTVPGHYNSNFLRCEDVIFESHDIESLLDFLEINVLNV